MRNLVVALRVQPLSSASLPIEVTIGVVIDTDAGMCERRLGDSTEMSDPLAIGGT